MNIFRNFLSLIKSFKSSSIINIIGLAVALIVFFIVAIKAYYDFTYDRSYVNADEILQFNLYHVNSGETSTNINFQIPAQVAQNIP